MTHRRNLIACDRNIFFSFSVHSSPICGGGIDSQYARKAAFPRLNGAASRSPLQMLTGYKTRYYYVPIPEPPPTFHKPPNNYLVDESRRELPSDSCRHKRYMSSGWKLNSRSSKPGLTFFSQRGVDCIVMLLPCLRLASWTFNVESEAFNRVLAIP